MTSLRTPLTSRVAPSLPNTLSFSRIEFSSIPEINLIFSPERFNAKVRAEDFENQNLIGCKSAFNNDTSSYVKNYTKRNRDIRLPEEQRIRLLKDNPSNSLSNSTFSIDSKLGVVSQSAPFPKPKLLPFSSGKIEAVTPYNIHVEGKSVRPRTISTPSSTTTRPQSSSKPWTSLADVCTYRPKSSRSLIAPFAMRTGGIDPSRSRIVFQRIRKSNAAGELVDLRVQSRAIESLPLQSSTIHPRYPPINCEVTLLRNPQSNFRFSRPRSSHQISRTALNSLDNSTTILPDFSRSSTYALTNYKLNKDQ